MMWAVRRIITFYVVLPELAEAILRGSLNTISVLCRRAISVVCYEDNVEIRAGHDIAGS